MGKRAARKAEETQVASVQAGAIPALVPQPHGGALYAGGVPGHRGGGGRRPSAVRDACLQHFAERVPRLAMIADGMVPLRETCPVCGHQGEEAVGKGASVEEQLRAHDMLAKYGLGEKGEYAADVVQDNLNRMLMLAETLMEPADFQHYAQQCAIVWGQHAG